MFMFFSAQRLFPRNHRDSQDVFFWRLPTEQFLVPENISNIKISWNSVGKKTSSTPKKTNMESQTWWFGDVSPSPRGIFRFHVSQQFFGTIFSYIFCLAGSRIPLHSGTPSSKSTRPTSQQVRLEKKAGNWKMHLGVPKGIYAVHIQDINFIH